MPEFIIYGHISTKIAILGQKSGNFRKIGLFFAFFGLLKSLTTSSRDSPHRALALRVRLAHGAQGPGRKIRPHPHHHARRLPQGPRRLSGIHPQRNGRALKWRGRFSCPQCGDSRLNRSLNETDPFIGFGQKIVNGNEPQRAWKAKNSRKRHFGADFWHFSSKNRDFGPENRHFSKIRPVFRRNSHAKVAKWLGITLNFFAILAFLARNGSRIGVHPGWISAFPPAAFRGPDHSPFS